MKKRVWKSGLCLMLAAAMTVSSVAAGTELSEAKKAEKKAALKTKKVTLIKGKKKKIKITGKGAKAKYTFKSNSKVVKVSKKGVITAKKAGSARVTVKEKYKKKTRKLGVVKVKVKKDGGSVQSPVVTAAAPAVSTGSSLAAPTVKGNGTNNPAGTGNPATDQPKELVPAKVTEAPGTHAVAGLPLIYSDIPDVDYIRVGEDYYMVSTTMFLSPGVPVMHSKDLVHWEIVSYVYDTLEDNDTTNLTNGKQCYGKGSWAAGLKYHDGTYYVCFSSNDQSKCYIYTTDDIRGRNWKKHSVSGLRHDPGLLFDDGKSYIVSGNGTITLQEFTLTEDGIDFKGTARTIIERRPATGRGRLCSAATATPARGVLPRVVSLIRYTATGMRSSLRITGQWEGLRYSWMCTGWKTGP